MELTTKQETRTELIRQLDELVEEGVIGSYGEISIT